MLATASVEEGSSGKDDKGSGFSVGSDTRRNCVDVDDEDDAMEALIASA